MDKDTTTFDLDDEQYYDLTEEEQQEVEENTRGLIIDIMFPDGEGMDD